MSAVGSILTNTGALSALNSIAQTSQTTGTLQNELASGLAINSPADNPAGYITAQGFTSQINGLTQATSNANQGVSLLQTAQSAIGQQVSIVQQLNSIAVQAANSTETSSETGSLQNLVAQLTTQVTTIAKQTQFNNVSLLDGTFNGQFQIGANAGQSITVGIKSTAASSIGMYWSSNNVNSDGAVTAAKDGTNNISSGAFIPGSASDDTSYKAGKIVINGTTIGGDENPLSPTGSAAGIAAAINNTNTGGVTAVASGVNQAKYKVGAAAGAGSGLTLKSSASGAAFAGAGVSVLFSENETASGMAQQINNAVKVATGGVGKGISASATSSGKLVIKQGSGKTIQFSKPTPTGTETASMAKLTSVAGGNAPLNADDMQQANIQLMSSSTFTASGLGNWGSATSGPTSNSPQLASLADINVTSPTNAENAMNVIKYALQTLSNTDGGLGASQQRMTATINNLTATTTNATAALGVVQDANIPAVANQLTQAQIQAQSGVAALKSSTQLQQTYLSLLP